MKWEDLISVLTESLGAAGVWGRAKGEVGFCVGLGCSDLDGVRPGWWQGGGSETLHRLLDSI